MLLKVVDEGKFRDITIGEGEMFLLPPNTPHNPVRFANTVGIVLEQPRPEGSLDRLRWYCTNCHEIVDEAAFHCTDLGTQIKEAVNSFKDSEQRRTCKKCGTVAEAAPKPGSIQDPNQVWNGMALTMHVSARCSNTYGYPNIWLCFLELIWAFRLLNDNLNIPLLQLLPPYLNTSPHHISRYYRSHTLRRTRQYNITFF